MRKFYLLFIVVHIAILLHSHTPSLVKDIYNYTNIGSITGVPNYAGGTEEGTVLVKDITTIKRLSCAPGTAVTMLTGVV